MIIRYCTQQTFHKNEIVYSKQLTRTSMFSVTFVGFFKHLFVINFPGVSSAEASSVVTTFFACAQTTLLLRYTHSGTLHVPS